MQHPIRSATARIEPITAPAIVPALEERFGVDDEDEFGCTITTVGVGVMLIVEDAVAVEALALEAEAEAADVADADDALAAEAEDCAALDQLSRVAKGI